MSKSMHRTVNNNYRLDENQAVNQLLDVCQSSAESQHKIKQDATELVKAIRAARAGTGGLDAFMYEYDLSSAEGIALMCTAEAMLRIPDATTANQLIKDKLAQADWASHLSQDKGFQMNAATWGLMITGKILSPSQTSATLLSRTLKGLVSKTGKPVIRTMIAQAMKILGEQFVMGRTIEAAIKRAKKEEAQGYRFSYDMLGEAARTQADAERYFLSYENAITAVGKAALDRKPSDRAEVSIKLSALHPRYEHSQAERVLLELTPRLKQLALTAKQYNISLTVDAEEADRLILSLDIFAKVFNDPDMGDWQGLGLAVQAYQKRAPQVLDFLVDLQRGSNRKIPVRLVKGAYWDSEIKLAQEQGLSGYPVYSRKSNTDVSYLACAQKMLANRDAFIVRFATHNARTIAAILHVAEDKLDDFEFQCLHGMGHGVYDEIVGPTKRNIPCRVYAPVGSHETLLPYLVRRLLENGANTSFVNRIADDQLPIDALVVDPVDVVSQFADKANPYIPLPVNLYGESRLNSRGIDVSDEAIWQATADKMAASRQENWQALVSLKKAGQTMSIHNPSNTTQKIGAVPVAEAAEIEKVLLSTSTHTTWCELSVDERASCLESMADLLEDNMEQLMGLLSLEAGKTVNDTINEVREAVDFCRYYANQARIQFNKIDLPGPTGETNALTVEQRGTILCISPWNFPLAIFLGQISAALVAGNTVIAKPAEQTPFVALYAAKLFHQAGVPKEALQILLGPGETVAARCVADKRIKGVMFTGSTQTAKIIHQSLANRPGEIVPLIAETGGQNVMIVDSSALLEQLVLDVMGSAFGSAGQRCSALRILYIQEEIADNFIEMLSGAMQELVVGEPSLLKTDVGPMIDADALALMKAHVSAMKDKGRIIGQAPLPTENTGYYFAPVAIELSDLSILTQEVFGPILHVKRFKSSALNQVIDEVNEMGYGLTLGIQSRINETVETIVNRAKVGNIYVNRNMIGAVVGVQPFGGCGLSGTGPKAGGPHYLNRLVTEKTVTVNTAAAGGNASLMSLPTDGDLN